MTAADRACPNKRTAAPSAAAIVRGRGGCQRARSQRVSAGGQGRQGGGMADGLWPWPDRQRLCAWAARVSTGPGSPGDSNGPAVCPSAQVLTAGGRRL